MERKTAGTAAPTTPPTTGGTAYMSQPEEVLSEEALPVEPDAALVRRSLAGDAAAFGDLYSRHATGVGVHVRRALPGARLDVADAVQDAFVRAWCRLPQLRDPERFAPWVRAIALSAARDALRAAGREVALDEVPAGSAPPESVEDALAVRQAMRALPAPQQAAVALCYFDGLTPVEAARRLGVPVTTVRGRLQTGRAALRARLARGGAWAGPDAASAVTRSSLEAVLVSIRRRNLGESHDLHGRPVILFCGVPMDVEVAPSPDDRFHLRGSVWAVGEGALRAVTLRCDGVDDALAVGPHPGALFGGTRGGPDGSLQTIIEDVVGSWTRVREAVVGAAYGGDGVARHLAETLGAPFLRLSLVSPRAEGVWVAADDHAARAELARVLADNHTSDKGWHGPEVRGALTLEVPPGSTLVVATFWGISGRVALGGTAAHVACIGARSVAVERHAGDLTLWEAPLERVAGLRGALRQRLASERSGHWDDGCIRRGDPAKVTISGLDGSADIAVGRTDITLDQPRGVLRVENRFGDTTLRLGDASVSGELRSLSGRVSLQVPRDVAVPGLGVTTAYGEVRWNGDLADLNGDWRLHAWNTPQTVALGPQGGGEPGLRLHSEAGAAVIERVDARIEARIAETPAAPQA